MTRLTGEAWEEIAKMKRVSRGHYPQGSVLAEGNLHKAARAKVSGVSEDLPVGLPGEPLPPHGPAQSQQPCLVLHALPPGPLSLRPPSSPPSPWPGAGPRAGTFACREPGDRRRAWPTSLLGAAGAGLRAHAQRPYGSPEGGEGGAAQVSPGGGGGDDGYAAGAGTMYPL